MKTTLPLRLAVLIAALLQPVTAYLSVFADSGRLTSDVGDPIITPAGYAFGIWSVITLGSVRIVGTRTCMMRLHHTYSLRSSAFPLGSMLQTVSGYGVLSPYLLSWGMASTMHSEES
jgi:hypothetical protein